jgi:hypothetical protein
MNPYDEAMIEPKTRAMVAAFLRRQGHKVAAESLESGMDPKEADALVAYQERLAACADRLECSECGGVLTKKVDPRQAGPSEIQGVWHNFRCTACGHFFDRCEPETPPPVN